MASVEQKNEPQRHAEAAGALTGATGSLTPPGSDEEFIPAERREVEPGEKRAHVGPEPQLPSETPPDG